MSEDRQEIHIFVTGVVQGVGFRAAVKRHASLHGITGFVRNLPDGRVEICAQGKEEQIQKFIGIVQARPGGGSVTGIETRYRSPRELFASFEIR